MCRSSPFRPTASFVFTVLVLAGCGSDDLAQDFGTQAVVIGIDGADWKVIDALAAEGHLPN